MKIKLEIINLTLDDCNILVPRINLIKDKIYPKLKVEYTLFKKNTNSIRINQEINDNDTALTLFNLFNNLNFNQKGKNKIQFHCSLNNNITEYGKEE